MKKINLGFTLSEVLVVIGIIGVVAAMVVPQIVKQPDSINGAMLGRTISAIQNGTANILTTARSLKSENNTIETLDIIRMKDINANWSGNNDYLVPAHIFGDTLMLMNASLSQDDSSYLNSVLSDYGYGNGENAYPAYKINRSRALVIPQTNTAINGTPSEDEVLMRIFIDTNGTEGPNRFGADLFMFGLLNNGQMVPAGSSAYNNNSHTLNENIALYTEACSGDIIPDDGRSCAARVMTDGWEIKYKR